MIAGKYHTLVSTIMKLNNLNNDRINIGQVLIIGNETAQDNGKPDSIKIKQPVKIPAAKDTTTLTKKETVKIKKDSLTLKKDSIKKVESMKQDSVKKADKTSMSADYKTFQANNKPMKEFQEKGVAAWIDDEDVNPRKYFGLHRTAPIGTIIKVTNPMNHKYVFVKVVGTLPDTGDNANIIIKISKASASKLEVLDAHFQAILDYATNEY
jgi:rare lipoprotein A (peptidoglycan hydrolase)